MKQRWKYRRKNVSPPTLQGQVGQQFARFILSVLLSAGLFSCFGGPVPDPPNSEGDKPLDITYTAPKDVTSNGNATATPTTPAGNNIGAGQVNPTTGAGGTSGTPGTTGTPVITTPTATTAPVAPPNAGTTGGAAGGAYSGNDSSMTEQTPDVVDAGIVDSGSQTATGASPPGFDPLQIESLQVVEIPWTLVGSVTTILTIEGRPGSMQAGQVLWVWNLDIALPPVIVEPEEDGSFQVQLLYSYGDVLRFQVREAESYYEPTDLLLQQQSSQFVFAPTLSCISIESELSIQDTQELTLLNQCADVVRIDEVRFHTLGASIEVEDISGTVVPPESSQVIHLQSTGNPNLRWANEDILLITVSFGDQTFRFAVNVYVE